MAAARIIDETGRLGPWTEAIQDVLGAAGYGMTGADDDSAGLTVLFRPEDADSSEERIPGDLLVLSIPGENGPLDDAAARTEVIGSSRLKARHRLSETPFSSEMAEELRPLVKLFVH